MRILVAAVLLMTTVLLGGCAARDPASPATTATATPSPEAETTEPEPTVDPARVAAAVAALRGYLLAADAGDCAAVKTHVLLPGQVECSDIRTNAGQWSAGGNDLATLDITAEIYDDSASATVSWSDRAPDTWDLQEVDGTWLVLNIDATDDA